MEDWRKFVALGADAVVVGIVYLFYKRQVRDAQAVEQAPLFTSQAPELLDALKAAPDKALPYVCVEGVARPVEAALRSQYTDNKGVIQRVQYLEHRMKRVQGFWKEETKLLKDNISTALFQLTTPVLPSHKSSPPVDVLDCMSADFLNDSLTTVYDVYEPSKDGFLSRSIDRLFGEMTKGFQQRELMLSVGTPLLGVGRLVLSEEGQRIQLGPSYDGRRYILTTLTRHEVIRSLRKDAWTLRLLLWLLGGVGAVLAVYLMYKYIGKWKRYAEFRKRLDDVRRARRRELPEEAHDGESACVVCLTNVRTVIVLDCGHVCLCEACSQQLTGDRARCPVCRRAVARFMPVYIP